MGPAPSVYDQLGEVVQRSGNRSPNNAPRNTYLTRDERWVAVSASATSVARRVMTLVGRPDLTEQAWFDSAGERVRHGEEIDEPVARWIRARDLDDVVSAFAEAGAALAPIYDTAQLMDDVQIRHRDAITTVADEDLGPLRMQNVLCRMSGTPGQIRSPGRRLGQDTEDVYRDILGLDDSELAYFRRQGVI